MISQSMSPLAKLLETYRELSETQREKGNYFERLVKAYLLNEPSYKDLFNGKVFLWEEWRHYWMAQGNSDPQTDAGIDLVAVEDTKDNPRIFAIQAKFYAEDAKIRKGDGIDSFFSAMGKKPYTNGLLFLTNYKASIHVIEAMKGRDKPVNIVSLSDLEASQIEWSQYQPNVAPVLRAKKTLRAHQSSALMAVEQGLEAADRGKLIMACGTGKTFTSLKIAEKLAGKNKRVLFLVPSLSLLSQTLTEWTQESETPLHCFAVCSDGDVGKKKAADDDFAMLTHELRYPATTDAARLAKEIKNRHDDQHMSVVFSTYHSIDVISRAQKEHGLANFDLIICDEAHRTTGATFENDSESNFVKVHDADFIKSNKRIYMTATPRIYGDAAKAKEDQGGVKLCSMDDVTLYGGELFVINFSEAVSRGLLCDYKVIVLTVDEAHISTRLQSLLADENNQLKVDDAAKIVGCWKALSKQSLADGEDDGFDTDSEPMRRAVAFCQVIEPNTNKAAKTHKVSSKNIASMFQTVVEAYQEKEPDHNSLMCEAAHVDGSMNASEKDAKLQWLKAEAPDNTCRILSNVRCLSEGVDVPALDAVLFLTPRNSQVDVVQSVGRVMRTVKDRDGNDLKKLGYVILPVVIPTGVSPHEALNDNKTYKVVWDVLQALRSHDDRFDAMINKLDLIGKTNGKMEVIAITDNVQAKSSKSDAKKKPTGKGQFGIGVNHDAEDQLKNQAGLEFEVGEIERALYAKVVKKCGNRNHWGDWANDIAKIANTHITRINAIVKNPANTKEQQAFNEFAKELRDDLNDSITDAEVIEMLAQHLITKPVFDALFSDYNFTDHNPMSNAMQGVLDVLQEHRLDKEADTLEKFYASVKMRAEGIDNAQGKQKIVVELYDKFFRNAFPKMTERLGIVYTPVEVVDFIIHSVNDILKQEFNQTLASDGVHIIDPFTGTGTFITRLLQSGLIPVDKLKAKYKSEIHANEIVLLAYYIAAINIEAVYHSLVGDNYVPFEGICLTDTFQLWEKEDLVDEILVQNSARRRKQKKLDIKVIIGNPPYSSGQNSANDNNQNVAYPHLDDRIRNTYAERSTATNKNALYDSYIRAIRWASDRIGNAGVIGFVSGSGFSEKPAMNGLRKCLAEEFSSVYVFNLRGDIRKNMLSKGVAREGQNIFGSGSMTGINITIFVKNPIGNQHGQIFYHNIGNDLTTSEKLDAIRSFSSISGITEENLWQEILPDQHGDWLSQRDDSFSNFIVLGDKDGKPEPKLFANYSRGVATARDAWCYNSSKAGCKNNMVRMIAFYNAELARFDAACVGLSRKDREGKVDDLINTDSTCISWNRSLKNEFTKGSQISYLENNLIPSLYRPFTKQWLYFNRQLNDMIYQMPRIFPDNTVENLIICVSGVGARAGFSTLIANALPCLDNIEKGQCFPLYLYESLDERDHIDFDGTGDLFAAKQYDHAARKNGYVRNDAITDGGLRCFSDAYANEKISKEDVFYYVYGLLHSSDYRESYADNLSKELPRIPCVKTAKDFWHFSQAGRDLAALHLNYETVDCYPVTLDTGKKKLAELDDKDFYVTKMKFAKKGEKHTVIYNHQITIRDIPEEAFDYVVNGKAALDWVIERQAVNTHKDSGIVNDANDWAIETMDNAKYPLELFMRVITVSLETMKIVNALPKLDI